MDIFARYGNGQSHENSEQLEVATQEKAGKEGIGREATEKESGVRANMQHNKAEGPQGEQTEEHFCYEAGKHRPCSWIFCTQACKQKTSSVIQQLLFSGGEVMLSINRANLDRLSPAPPQGVALSTDEIIRRAARYELQQPPSPLEEWEIGRASCRERV